MIFRCPVISETRLQTDVKHRVGDASEYDQFLLSLFASRHCAFSRTSMRYHLRVFHYNLAQINLIICVKTDLFD